MSFKSVLFLCLVAMTAMAAAADAVRLAKERLGCSDAELQACRAEIQQAFNDCLHLTTVEDIKTCIDDILAATDCKTCLCDILPFIC